MESDTWTFGLPVATMPGSDASENDQPPPTARKGTLSASAVLTPLAISSTDVGKNIFLAIYACVLGRFCYKGLNPSTHGAATETTCAAGGNTTCPQTPQFPVSA